MDAFVEVDPYWDGTALMVHHSCFESEAGFHRLSALVLYVLHWAKFTITRWCSVRRSSCLYVLSEVMGLSAFVRILRADEAVSGYHLNGYYKLTAAPKTITCCCNSFADWRRSDQFRNVQRQSFFAKSRRLSRDIAGSFAAYRFLEGLVLGQGCIIPCVGCDGS